MTEFQYNILYFLYFALMAAVTITKILIYAYVAIRFAGFIENIKEDIKNKDNRK